MRSSRQRRGAALLGAAMITACLVLGAAPGTAQPADKDHDRVFKDVRRGDVVRMRAIIRRIRRRYPGQVVDAEYVEDKGLFRVLWQTVNGEIYTIMVNAREGHITEVLHRGRRIWERGDDEPRRPRQ